MKQTSILTESIDEIISNKEIPGVVMGIVEKEGLKYTHSKGSAHDKRKLEINDDTIFDLASLTKVVATLPAILKLVEDGSISIEDDLSKFLHGNNFHNIKIIELLQHTTGLPAFYPFFKHEGLKKDWIINKIASLTMETTKNKTVLYSDLNFILLSYVVEEVTKQSFEKYTLKEIFHPLNMRNTYFNPDKSYLSNIAATEYREEKKEYDHGYVHDENALCMGGVAGHAGLFSNLKDLSKFAQMILDPNHFENSILQEKTIKLSIDTRIECNLMRGLGWQFNEQKIISDRFTNLSFGHTGFTGTSIWFDEYRRFAVILLTNRVHYGRDSTIAPVRRRLHNIAYDSLNKKHERGQ